MPEKIIIDAQEEFGETGSGKARKYVENQLKREALINKGLALLIIALIVVKCVGI